MSVVTSYRITSKEDIASKLKENGVLINMKTENGRTTCQIDISKASPETWVTDAEIILKHGVLTMGPVSLEQTMLKCAGVIGTDFLKENERLSHYNYDKDGNLGCYVDNTLADAPNRSRKFIKFNEAQIALIKERAEKIVAMYEPEPNSNWLRRDYTEEETAKLPLYPFYIENDGKTLCRCANYATAMDDNIPFYISVALPDTEMNIVQCTESDLDIDAVVKNGKVLKNNKFCK